MKVLQNFQKFRVLWHGRTELTEVPGTGNTRVNAHPMAGSSIQAGGLNSTCMAFSLKANVPGAISRFWGNYELSTKPAPREAINREPQ